VIGMFEGWIGGAVPPRRAYLESHRDGTATADDSWRAGGRQQAVGAPAFSTSIRTASRKEAGRRAVDGAARVVAISTTPPAPQRAPISAGRFRCVRYGRDATRHRRLC
jgi:hypothetical protein